MKTVIFVPYGGLSKEGGLIHLLANYINSSLGSVIQLRCNGVFSLCDRDEEVSWQRKLDTCAVCMTNQAILANWCNADIFDLSQYLTPEEVVATKRWMHTLPANSLENLNFRGTNLYDVCLSSLQLRLACSQLDTANKKHEQIIRRILLSAARMCLATTRFNNQIGPTLSIVAGGQDFMSHSFVLQSRRQDCDVAIFNLDINERCVKISHPRSGKLFACELLITDISHMRADNRTWPREIINLLEDILAFLDISQTQIPLPLAR